MQTMLIVDLRTFREAVRLVARATNRRHENNACHGIAVSASENGWQVRATDLETYASVSSDGFDPASAVVAVVDAKALKGALKAGKGGIGLAVAAEGVTLEMGGAQRRFEAFDFSGWAAKDAMPAFPAAGTGIEIDAAKFREALATCAPFVAGERGRYALNAVQVVTHGRELRFCGTDGRALAHVAIPGGRLAFPVMASAKVCEIVTAALDGVESARLSVSETDIIVTAKRAGVTITAGGIQAEGQYPDYWAIVPRKNDKRMTLDRDALLAALAIAESATAIESRTVRLEFNAGKLALTGESFGAGSATASVDYAGEGLAGPIGFYPALLRRALKAMPKGRVSLALKNADTGAMVTSDEGTGFIDLFALVMPLEVE